MIDEFGCFVLKYAREAHAGDNLYDRRYDREIEKEMRCPREQDFSDLISCDDNSDGGDDTADNFVVADDEGGVATPLGDAQPSHYMPDAVSDNVDKLAGIIIVDWAISTRVARHGHAAGLYFISRKEEGGNERYR
ncbi:hypothetical protein WS97_00030 [Burkholderia territorii]|uniref:hypothetical protein n=1 Tax=Burkholderia territorii TaxID=1503055 RepID=UPI0007523206|nr:hypothetical protein [Burkholderia territorii]KVL38351.1 hypothetical protein WS97_00030 [Burkholderia territorii]KWO47660.1 hypothetical protein WT98_21100 [Burkholderia territorii]